MNMDFTETTMLDADVRMRETKDGYLVCSPRIARTGIQIYRGSEVGRPDLTEVRVYRPESEVMHKDAVASLAFKPVTIEHPDQPITAKNWKDLAVGQLSDEALRDGEFIRTPMILMDADAINIVRSGKRELSVGYTALLKWGDGETDKGEKYNAIQTAIRANHVAITHTARGGDKLRMGDTNSKEKVMRKILVDGIPVEMEDRDAHLIERRLSALEQAVTDAKTTAQAEVATAKTELANATAVAATKDAEIATLKQQLVDSKITPQKLQEMARARAGLEQRAKSLLDSVQLDGRGDEEVRRQVVFAKLGDTAKDWTDDMVTASFNTLAVSRDSGSGLQHVVQVIKGNDTFTGSVDPVAAAYKEYDDVLFNRWKTAGQRVPA